MPSATHMYMDKSEAELQKKAIALQEKLDKSGFKGHLAKVGEKVIAQMPSINAHTGQGWIQFVCGTVIDLQHRGINSNCRYRITVEWRITQNEYGWGMVENRSGETRNPTANQVNPYYGRDIAAVILEETGLPLDQFLSHPLTRFGGKQKPRKVYPRKTKAKSTGDRLRRLFDQKATETRNTKKRIRAIATEENLDLVFVARELQKTGVVVQQKWVDQIMDQELSA